MKKIIIVGADPPYLRSLIEGHFPDCELDFVKDMPEKIGPDDTVILDIFENPDKILPNVRDLLEDVAIKSMPPPPAIGEPATPFESLQQNHRRYKRLRYR